MEMRNILILSILGLVLTVVQATDYCKKSCNGNKNIGCDNEGTWGPNCPSDATLVTLTPQEKALIVDRHNQHRNFIAGGGDPKLSAACRMATIKWNDDLAYLAGLNVRSCQMRHDACRNTDVFDWAGQNLALIYYFVPMNASKNLLQGIDMWYKEVADTKQAYIDAYPQNYKGPAIGHFTVMVADRNTDVGCAVSTYSVSGQTYKGFLLACNYATTNVLGIKMYNSCPKPATKCTTGTNPKHKNLCSAKEVYDVNNIYY